MNDWLAKINKINNSQRIKQEDPRCHGIVLLESWTLHGDRIVLLGSWTLHGLLGTTWGWDSPLGVLDLLGFRTLVGNLGHECGIGLCRSELYM